ncbi:MAG: DUF433 domain-containing protein [Planctomycetes bacterium]|nr:DUF433 domain-containing protein [Planctomycetota bacterium]
MTTLDTLAAEPAPIRHDAEGVARVGGTRVRLESVITAFQNGCAAEEILLKYPSLHLTDIYGVIAYYLWRRDEIEAYLHERQSMEAQVREENEARFPPEGVRQRLLARRVPSP